MIKSNGGIIGPDNVTTGGPFGSASGVFKLGEVTDLVKESKWPTPGPQGYQSANSCRFNGSSSKLVKSQSAGNRDLWTYSVWIKWSAITTTTTTFFASSDGSNLYAYIGIQSYKIRFLDYNSGNQTNLITNRLFRDPSAWYHVVLAYDSAQGTASNRVKLYINGVQETSFSTETYPSQGLDSAVNVNSSNFIISSNQDQSSGSMWNGYMAESCFIDGQALAPTSFGEFNSQTGIWVPIDVSGLTFGTNGFYQNYSNASALGEDFSGNNNDFTVSNLTSIDQTTDTCSTNFATMNPLDTFNSPAISDGNTVCPGGSSGDKSVRSTIAISQGKWYWEVNCDISNALYIGIINTEVALAVGFDLSVASTNSVIYNANGGGLTKNGSAVATYTNASNSTIGFALDLDAGTLKLSKDGVFFNSGNAVVTGIASDTYSPVFCPNAGGSPATAKVNFGNPAYAISSGNTDGNGFGNFEYAVPSGYLSLNTKNLAVVLA